MSGSDPSTKEIREFLKMGCPRDDKDIGGL